MHEMAIAQSILNLVIEETTGRKVKRVRTVNLKVGQLSGVVPEALGFCWQMVSQDSPAAGSKLAIEEEPLVAVCQACGEFKIEDYLFACPRCSSGDITITQGRELYLSSIEVD